MIRELATKGLKFGLVGAVGWAVNSVAYYVLTRGFGVFDLYANGLAVVIAAGFNFVGNVLNGNIKIESSGRKFLINESRTENKGRA